MTAAPQPPATPSGWLDAVGRARPDVVLMAPYMAYLALLALISAFPAEQEWIPIIIRGVGSLLVAFALLPYMPSWGRPMFWLAIPAGLFAAWGWVYGQYVFDDFGLGGRLPGMPGQKAITDPRDALGADDLFWTTTVLRIVVACTAVPVVEELFWRGFLLRAFISWDKFDSVPMGKFTWFSFIGTSLLSTVQHPDNWGVSILCWMFFNALFYLTRSLWCLIVVHAVTNLALYYYVVRVGDWSFW